MTEARHLYIFLLPSNLFHLSKNPSLCFFVMKQALGSAALHSKEPVPVIPHFK